jgi:NAD(P)-dependent dehydrogenase (short-subunit alcohol dehydrogenase family)
MLLEDRTAVIYGGAGAIGSAVARVFAREGATVFLAGRTRTKLDAVADEIRASGGAARTAEVDALDEQAVDAHADGVAAERGGIDVSFNLIGHGYVQGTPIHEMQVDDYTGAVLTSVRTTFLTARAAARHMIGSGGGVILSFGGEGHPFRAHHLGSLQTCFHAVEAMRRQLAVELGQHGIRVVTLRTGGVPATIPDDFEGADAIRDSITAATLLGRGATPEDVGNAAAFAASDRARTMTAATINVSCGTLID